MELHFLKTAFPDLSIVFRSQTEGNYEWAELISDQNGENITVRFDGDGLREYTVYLSEHHLHLKSREEAISHILALMRGDLVMVMLTESFCGEDVTMMSSAIDSAILADPTYSSLRTHFYCESTDPHWLHNRLRIRSWRQDKCLDGHFEEDPNGQIFLKTMSCI